jgi:hypothetical protein
MFASFAGFETRRALLLEFAEAYWQTRGFSQLPRNQAFRLVDSFIKRLRTRAGGRPELAQAIRKHGHIIVNGPTLDMVGELRKTVPT